jgi:heterotetrameric sarcosine oxidase gamma subunit
MSTARRLSAIYDVLEPLQGRWVERAGWMVLESLQDPAVEADLVRRGTGLADASSEGKLDVKGREEFVDRGTLAVLDLSPRHALVLTPPGDEQKVARDLATRGKDRCLHITDVTSSLASFVLAGPGARDTLTHLSALDLRDGSFPNLRVAAGSLARVHCIVWRNDWGGLPVFRLLVARDVGRYVWEAIVDAGVNFDLVPFGYAAERLLRQGALD